jgi:hypothetical protein
MFSSVDVVGDAVDDDRPREMRAGRTAAGSYGSRRRRADCAAREKQRGQHDVIRRKERGRRVTHDVEHRVDVPIPVLLWVEVEAGHARKLEAARLRPSAPVRVERRPEGRRVRRSGTVARQAGVLTEVV